MVTSLTSVHLVAFHAWIANKGVTTYDYIGYRKDLKEKKALLKADKLSQQEFDEWK